MVYKYGVRVEKTHSLWLGLGVSTITEKALVVSLLFWEISIGKVYKD